MELTCSEKEVQKDGNRFLINIWEDIRDYNQDSLLSRAIDV